MHCGARTKLGVLVIATRMHLKLIGADDEQPCQCKYIYIYRSVSVVAVYCANAAVITDADDETALVNIVAANWMLPDVG